MEDLRKEKIKMVEEKKVVKNKPSLFKIIKFWCLVHYKLLIIITGLIIIISFPYMVGNFFGYIIKNILDGFVSQFI